MPNRSPRLREFNYLGLCRYFLTICVFPRRPVFVDDVNSRWLLEQLLLTASHFGFSVTAYCLMPDHLHALVEGEREDADLKKFVARWKQLTAHRWKQRTGDGLWQQGFFDRVLREEDLDTAIVSSIVGNPVRAGLVRQAADYPLSGSSTYSFAELADVVMDWSPSGR